MLHNFEGLKDWNSCELILVLCSWQSHENTKLRLFLMKIISTSGIFSGTGLLNVVGGPIEALGPVTSWSIWSLGPFIACLTASTAICFSLSEPGPRELRPLNNTISVLLVSQVLRTKKVLLFSLCKIMLLDDPPALYLWSCQSSFRELSRQTTSKSALFILKETTFSSPVSPIFNIENLFLVLTWESKPARDLLWLLLPWPQVERVPGPSWRSSESN